MGYLWIAVMNNDDDDDDDELFVWYAWPIKGV